MRTGTEIVGMVAKSGDIKRCIPPLKVALVLIYRNVAFFDDDALCHALTLTSDPLTLKVRDTSISYRLRSCDLMLRHPVRYRSCANSFC